MKCPYCKGRLEVERADRVSREWPLGVFHYSRAWHYRCDNCDAEWSKDGNKTVLVDKGNLPLDALFQEAE